MGKTQKKEAGTNNIKNEKIDVTSDLTEITQITRYYKQIMPKMKKPLIDEFKKKLPILI